MSEIFKASYLISNHLSGGVSFTVNLMIDSQTGEIVGTGHVFQAISPPLNVLTCLQGDYSYMCTMESCHILVVAEGFRINPLITLPPSGIPNTKLRMSLNDDWKSGTAVFQYVQDGKWQDSGYMKVELLKGESVRIDELAEHVKSKNSQPA
ncbi:MAG: DUF1842 domain-containing protein [Crocinitomicaceae bacterium]|nr:DUF1842 domain-containing protein [Flavobacteriales bacterium]NQZ37837.1 DUF1842 domain-containing protein [Crocinitomicaceae bacterium]